MQAALAQAKQGFANGEPPFGCVLVNDSGEIVVQEHDRVNELSDMSAHAETLAVKHACQILGRNDLGDLTLYTTVEPCAMCFTTAWLNNIEAIVFGISMERVDEITSGAQREITIPAEEMNQRSGSKVKIVSGVLQDVCCQLFFDYTR